MLHDAEVETHEERPILEIDPPAPTKPASLTGALVQRGRDRAATAPEAPAAIETLEAIAEPAEIAEVQTEAAPIEPIAAEAEALGEVPLVFEPREAAVAEAAPSRFTDALFVLACCAAFFATFLFALRF